MSVRELELRFVSALAATNNYFIFIAHHSCRCVPPVCASSIWNKQDPFGTNVVVISLGVCALAVLCVPVGFWNLDDNMRIQVGATVSMFAILACWFGYWIHRGLTPASIPFIGSAATAHPHIHTCMHTHTHAYTHTYTHTHTQTVDPLLRVVAVLVLLKI